MQNNAWRRAFLFSFLLVFAGLLISGAPRLIASPDDRSACARMGIRPVQAYLCVNPAAQMQSAQAECEIDNRPVQREDDSLFYASEGMFENSVSNTDANGNVLLCVNYMRSVYQVFALGDGFV